MELEGSGQPGALGTGEETGCVLNKRGILKSASQNGASMIYQGPRF